MQFNVNWIQIWNYNLSKRQRVAKNENKMLFNDLKHTFNQNQSKNSTEIQALLYNLKTRFSVLCFFFVQCCSDFPLYFSHNSSDSKIYRDAFNSHTVSDETMPMQLLLHRISGAHAHTHTLNIHQNVIPFNSFFYSFQNSKY